MFKERMKIARKQYKLHFRGRNADKIGFLGDDLGFEVSELHAEERAQCITFEANY